MHSKRYEGYILFFTLFVMQFLSYIAFENIQQILNLKKLTTRQIQQVNYQQTFNNLTAQIANQYSAQMCLTDSFIPEANKSVSWWSTHACSGNLFKFRYYYVAERLDSDPCELIKINNNQTLSSDYYRLTFALVTPGASTITHTLQEIIILPSNTKKTCHFSTHQIKRGRQFWREIY